MIVSARAHAALACISFGSEQCKESVYHTINMEMVWLQWPLLESVWLWHALLCIDVQCWLQLLA